MKFSIKDFSSKCDQIRSFLRIWLHLLKKSLLENFILCPVWYAFDLRPLFFPSRDGKIQAWSSEYKLTKLILQVGSVFCYQTS